MAKNKICRSIEMWYKFSLCENFQLRYWTEHKVEFDGDKESYNKATECRICGGPCGEDRTRGHCYLGGKFHGAAHQMIKAALWTTKYQFFSLKITENFQYFITFLNPLVVISLKLICELWKYLLFKLWIIESMPCHNF